MVTATARQVGARLPATAAYYELFTQAKEAGLGEQDAVALYRMLASMAGSSGRGMGPTPSERRRAGREPRGRETRERCAVLAPIR